MSLLEQAATIHKETKIKMANIVSKRIQMSNQAIKILKDNNLIEVTIDLNDGRTYSVVMPRNNCDNYVILSQCGNGIFARKIPLGNEYDKILALLLQEQ